jgi:dipeptidyl-peptidase 4
MRKLIVFALITVSVFSLHAQKKNISYDQAFRGTASNISKALPIVNKWVDDTHYLEPRKEADGSTKTYSVDVKTGNAQAYAGQTNLPSGPAPISVKGALNLTMSPDGKWAAYTKRDHNLYLTEAATQKETALTTDGSEVVLNGHASWVYFEEILGRQSRYRAFWWSNDSKHLVYMRFDDTKVPVFPIYWSDNQHGYIENQRYPKVGDDNPEVKVGIVSVDNPKTVWADFDPKDDQYFGQPYWAPNGQLWVQWMNRGQDNLKIYNVDLANGSKTVVYEEKQTTWIDLDDYDRIEFLESGKAFILKSDKTGWSQLYLHDMTGKQVNAITQGEFTVGQLLGSVQRQPGWKEI